MNVKPKKITPKQQEQLNKKLAPIYRNIGGLTFAVGLFALLAGLRIDKVNGTQPIFTLVFVAVSVHWFFSLIRVCFEKQLQKPFRNLNMRKTFRNNVPTQNAFI